MSDMQTMSPAPRRVSFIRAGQHELTKLNRGLKKLSQEALDVLKEQMTSDDPKLKLEAAKMVLRYHVDISKQINDEEMARAIAEIRFAGANTNSLSEDIDDMPVVDFDNLIET